MREIKFRAWNKACDYWSMDAAYPVSDGVVVHNGQCEYVKDGREFLLMQYTGLKDKSGKEIFESDLIQADDDKFYAQVFFDEAALCWSAKLYLNRKPIEVMTLGRFINQRERAVMGRMEVIGNIHENPELLEEK